PCALDGPGDGVAGQDAQVTAQVHHRGIQPHTRVDRHLGPLLAQITQHPPPQLGDGELPCLHTAAPFMQTTPAPPWRAVPAPGRRPGPSPPAPDRRGPPRGTRRTASGPPLRGASPCGATGWPGPWPLPGAPATRKGWVL